MPIVSRVYWKGYLRLSLVTINIEIYSAVDSGSDISFRQIHKPSGRRIKYEKVVPGIGPVESSDIVKGYEVEDDTYVLIEPDEIKALQLPSEKSLDLVQFVDADEIDARYFERPYYMLPADEPSMDGYVVIAKALTAGNKVGLGQVTMRGREYLVAVSPIMDGKGLLMEILRYSDELRAAEAFYNEISTKTPDKELVALATELMSRKTAPFDPTAFSNRYGKALQDLVQSKTKGGSVVSTADSDLPRSAEIIDLMEALKKSVGEKEAKPRKARTQQASGAKRGKITRKGAS
ncbi:MAG: Ku protein [Hyphomicrobiaceae bacterium]